MTARGWGFVALVVTSAGCVDSPDCRPFTGLSNEQLVLFRGQLTRQDFTGGCFPDRKTTSADVFDRNGDRVPSQIVDDDGHGTARVEFTPVSLGTHTVVMRFQPDVPFQTRLLEVSEDRRAEAPVLEFTSLDVCRDVAVADSLVACQLDSALLIIQGSRVVRRSEGERFAEAPHALWTWRDTGLTRWTLDAAGAPTSLELTVPIALPSGERHAITVTDTDFMWPQDRRLQAVRVTDAGTLATWNPAPDGVVFRAAARVDGGVFWKDGATEDFCFQSPGSAARCQPSTLRPLRAQGEGMWIESDFGNLGFAQLGASPAPASVLFLPQAFSVLASVPIDFTDHPRFLLADRVTAIRPDTLGLDSWAGPPDGGASGVRAGHVWVRDGKKVRVWAR
jgi:hypothetical protein